MRRLSLVLLLPLALAACGGSSGPTGPGEPPVGNTAAFTQLAAGWGMTCGLNSVGKAYCWGNNLDGESGVGEGVAAAVTPTAVAGGRAYTQLTAGFNHVCALDAAGAAWCWGQNFLGSVGIPATTREVFTPTQVVGGQSFLEIKAGGYTTCGRTAAGAAWCWGRGTSGELGNGATTTSSVPVQVIGGLSFTKLGRGTYHSCGITAAGDAYCWGRNSGGSLGNGTTTDATAGPVAVSGGLKFVSIAGGQDHTCALTAAGKAYCWGGNNNGGLGDGTTTDRLVPTPVSGNLTFSSLNLSSYQSCGIVGSNNAYCWGSNWTAQLGDGSLSDRSAPTLVAGNHGFVFVAMGNEHGCGLTNAGEAWCWGTNGNAELGIGLYDGQLRISPVKVQMPN